MFQNITISKKTKIITACVALTLSSCAGYAVRPTVEFYKDLLGGYFAPKVYVAPLDEYERKTDELYHSQAHQATCLAQAKATVSLQLVQKYLHETTKQQEIATYALPSDLVDSVNANETARKAKTNTEAFYPQTKSKK